jgi:hypothetical protein
MSGENESPSWLTDTPAAEPVPPPQQTKPAPKTFVDETEAQLPPPPTATASAAPTPPPSDPQELTAEERESLKGVILFMRIANFAVSITIIVQSSLKLAWAFMSPQYWVLCLYAACGGCLICCTETQLSFVRTHIALNFGFLFSAPLRFAYYILLATVCYSMNDLFGRICAGCLVGIAFYNTYVIIRYPAYRKMRDQIAEEEDARINAAIREKVRKEATAAMFTSAK